MSIIKVGDIINRVEIEIKVTGKTKVRIEKYNVVVATEEKFVIDDRNFTTFDQLYQGKYSSCSDINRPHSHECNWQCRTLEDSVYCRDYSKSSPRVLFNRVKKALQKFIEEKHGRYGLLNRVVIGVEFPEEKKVEK